MSFGKYMGNGLGGVLGVVLSLTGASKIKFKSELSDLCRWAVLSGFVTLLSHFRRGFVTCSGHPVST
jgi:hypothetical protein